MPISSTRVLCYGHDPMLLLTRRWILEKEFCVENCSSLSQLAEMLGQGQVDLVLVCQSVPDSECDEVIELARSAWPAVKTLVLQESAHGVCSTHSDMAMENLGGPPVLLQEIHTLLGMATAQNAML